MNQPIKPKKPVAPKEPTEIFYYAGGSPSVFISSGEQSIEDLLRELKDLLPEGAAFDIGKVKIKIDENEDYSASQIFYDKPETLSYVDKNFAKKHAKWQAKMGEYEFKLRDYKKDLADYPRKLAEYNEWIKVEEIAAARKILEKHKVL